MAAKPPPAGRPMAVDPRQRPARGFGMCRVFEQHRQQFRDLGYRFIDVGSRKEDRLARDPDFEGNSLALVHAIRVPIDRRCLYRIRELITLRTILEVRAYRPVPATVGWHLGYPLVRPDRVKLRE